MQEGGSTPKDRLPKVKRWPRTVIWIFLKDQAFVFLIFFNVWESGWILILLQNRKPTKSLFWRRRIRKLAILLNVQIYSFTYIISFCWRLPVRELTPMTIQLNAGHLLWPHCAWVAWTRTQAEPPESGIHSASSKRQDHLQDQFSLRSKNCHPPFLVLIVLASHPWNLQKPVPRAFPVGYREVFPLKRIFTHPSGWKENKQVIQRHLNWPPIYPVTPV